MRALLRRSLVVIGSLTVAAMLFGAAQRPSTRGLEGADDTGFFAAAYAQPVPTTTASGKAKEDEICKKIDRCIMACQKAFAPCHMGCLKKYNDFAAMRVCAQPCTEARSKCAIECKPDECPPDHKAN